MFGFLKSLFNKILFAKASDEVLIEEYLKTQKNKYFDLLYQRYKDKVYGKCLSMLNDTELCYDAMQEIFIKVLLNLSKFKNDAKFSTWIYSITYNYCIDIIRREGKYIHSTLEDNTEISNSIYEDDDTDKKLLEINVDRLEVILDEIPFKDKSVLLMKYQGDLSIKDIAEITGKTESAIKMNLKRAKEKVLENIMNSILIEKFYT